MAERIPDTAQLRAALAVWHLGGVTRAAEEIGLTQPAVSRLVAALESELGFQLFTRDNRRLMVTAPGAAFLQQAEAALGGLGRLREWAAALQRGRSGILRIAAVSALAHGLAPRALVAFKQDYPDLAVEVIEIDRRQQVEALASRRIDVGLVALPASAPGLRVEMIVEGEAVCLLPEQHPLAAAEMLDPPALAGQSFIRLNEPRLLQSMVDAAFDRIGLVRHVSVAVNATPLMISCVAEGLGLAITHRMSTFVLPRGVVARPFRPTISFAYAALRRMDDPPNAFIDAYVAQARAVGRAWAGNS
ncbi:MAG: LysR substrate-binding domain-containing protein [Acetobacteraceae bacterium]|nr:LysR substrate-binding domain-containing protein [Acetobacteraceae bacterium]